MMSFTNTYFRILKLFLSFSLYLFCFVLLVKRAKNLIGLRNQSLIRKQQYESDLERGTLFCL